MHLNLVSILVVEVFYSPKTFKEEERVFSLDELPQSLGKKQPPTPEVAPTDDDYARVMYSILMWEHFLQALNQRVKQIKRLATRSSNEI